VVLYRLTEKLETGEDQIMAKILVILQFVCSPTFDSSSCRIGSAYSECSMDSVIMAKSSSKSVSEMTRSPSFSAKFRREVVFVIKR